MFIHIPKCGGTSIESLFRESGFSVSYLAVAKDGVNGQLNRVRRCSPQHMHGELLRSLFDLKRFEGIFSVVRDPINRFRSEYAMRDWSNAHVTEQAVEEWADEAFRQYLGNPYVFDNHIRPQSEFLVQGCEVFRLELGLEGAVQRLTQQYGLDLDPKGVGLKMISGRAGAVSSSAVPISGRLRERLLEFYSSDARFCWGSQASD